MSRREIVLLVSRAIAITLIVPALMSLFTFLPQVFMLAQIREPQHMPHFAWTEIIVSLVRIIVLLAIGALFWRCEPMIERLLLPVENAPDEGAAADV